MLFRSAPRKAALVPCASNSAPACSTHGLALQYFRQSVEQKFSESEYRATLASGIAHTMSLTPKPETARVRLLVCDTATGMIGSVDVPYPLRGAFQPRDPC